MRIGSARLIHVSAGDGFGNGYSTPGGAPMARDTYIFWSELAGSHRRESLGQASLSFESARGWDGDGIT